MLLIPAKLTYIFTRHVYRVRCGDERRAGRAQRVAGSKRLVARPRKIVLLPVIRLTSDSLFSVAYDDF